MARRSGQETREALVAAAGASFARVGYQAAGTAQIAAEAGVSEATLFKYFPTKQALLVEALAGVRQTLSSTLSGGQASVDGGPLERLRARAEALLLDPDFIRAMRLTSFAMALADDPAVADALRTGRAELRAQLGAILADGQATGSVRTDIPAEHMASLAIGFTNVAGIDLAVDPDEAPARLRELVRSLARLLRPVPAEALEGSPDD